jgi:hypothetical protein
LAKQDLKAGLSALPAAAAFSAMSRVGPDKGLSRDLHDTQIYKAASPAVVLIATDTSLGSGSLIDKEGLVLTNYHVVEGFPTVAVMFKPKQEGAKLSPKDAIEAKVVRVNIEKDLALLKLATVPSGIEPIAFGNMDDVQVGADMHAIGHPRGESWTYTKGIVSQIRPDYDWGGDGRIKHKATVIQTQTPINPGNSGGPLLDDNGKLVGVNSFVRRDAENVNFAVSVADVEMLLKQTKDVGAEKTPLPFPFKETKQCAEPQVIYEGPNYDETADLQILDTTCSGKANAQFILPRDKNEPMLLALFKDDPLKRTVLYVDPSRNAQWQLSFWRHNPADEWEMVCKHQPSGLKPSQCDSYKSFVSATQKISNETRSGAATDKAR